MQPDTTPEVPSSPGSTAAATAKSASRADGLRPDQIMGERQCGWCCNHFAVVRRPGRPLIYCSHSCRQRAYERRRGLGVLPPPDRIIMQPGGPLAHLRPRSGAYENGRISFGVGKSHAMRPAGIVGADGRRLTLCGLLMRSALRDFPVGQPGSCRTCERVSDVRPPARPRRPCDDLAAVRALIDAAAVEMSRSPAAEVPGHGGRDGGGGYPLRPAGDILADLLTAI
ncbi:MAG: hypothetical protein JWM34_268 [Ilumatobacteraceae bacterium]|nr:hypothetical protein [Ilumatobacteraceae bacterium]